VRKVEKAMKEALKNDRARIQVGRISSFGLMEMSRQRLRTGVLEASTKACPHCEGTGLMRTASSAGLSALRIIEDEAARGRGDRILLRAGAEAAIYVLNKKRTELAEIEERYGVTVEIAIEEAFEGARMTVESSGPRPQPRERPAMPPVVVDEEDDYLPEEELEAEEEEVSAEREEEGDGGRRRRRRRRRGGRGRRREGEGAESTESPAAADELPETAEEAPEAETLGAEESGEAPKRRGRRGGRNRRGRPESAPESGAAPEAFAEEAPMADLPTAEQPAPAEAEVEAEADDKPKTRRRPRARKKADEASDAATPPPVESVEVAQAVQEAVAESEPAAEEKPKRKSRAKKKADDAPVEPKPASRKAAAATIPTPEPSNEDVPGEPRRGWWQRTFG
jgi:ribonuclease E